MKRLKIAAPYLPRSPGRGRGDSSVGGGERFATTFSDKDPLVVVVAKRLPLRCISVHKKIRVPAPAVFAKDRAPVEYQCFMGIAKRNERLAGTQEPTHRCEPIVCADSTMYSDPWYCEGCLVVITGHSPQAEVAQVFGHELLVEREGGRLEGLEGEQQKGEEKETGEENNHHTTHR